jgi:hypothetical protein
MGWSEMSELWADISRGDVEALLDETYGEQRPPFVAAQARQIYRFCMM